MDIAFHALMGINLIKMDNATKFLKIYGKIRIHYVQNGTRKADVFNVRQDLSEIKTEYVKWLIQAVILIQIKQGNV